MEVAREGGYRVVYIYIFSCGAANFDGALHLLLLFCSLVCSGKN
jgi:hypothetical protein